MRLSALAAGLLFAAAAVAAEEPGWHSMSSPEIAAELKALHAAHPGLRERVEAISARFLGTPYRLGPLGEGPKGEFDRDPLVSFREADCTTFLEQVMALALEPDLEKATALLQRIRYKDGKIAYETRNHFTSVDWIPNNAAAGYLRDITREVAGTKTKTVAKVIRKREWYLQKSTSDLAGFDGLEPEAAEALVRRWRTRGEKYADETASVEYFPIEALPELLDRIPSGTIANLVREDKDGVPVLISHQGLIVEKGGARYLRHAAAGAAVQDVPALAYFYRYFHSKWRLLGLNLNAVSSPR